MINKKKIAAAMMAGALTLSVFAGPVAAYDHHDSDNGSRSNNEFSYRSDSNTNIDQHNSADFDNTISIRSNTGGNSSDGHWGSDHDSGDSDVSARIGNFANVNYANTGGSDRNWNANGWWKDHEKNNDDHNYDNDDKKDHGDYDHDDDNDRHRDHDSSKDHEHDNDQKHHDENGDDADHQHEFHASMSGHEEVPGPGDTDGNGHFKAMASHENNTLCVEMHVQNIEPANAAHIHYGKKGEAGPVVVPLPTPDANGNASGCVNVDSDVLWKITENPSHYYVNVHNAPFPNGALRGQLY
jgi:hypothetical protein